MTSPTQRTLERLRALGMRCAIVERFNPHVPPHGIRQDMFGIIDIVALDKKRGVVGIQSTGQGFSEHLRAMLTEKAKDCADWLSVPGTSLELWGWRKLKAQTGLREYWSPRIHVFTLSEFSHVQQDFQVSGSLVAHAAAGDDAIHLPHADRPGR